MVNRKDTESNRYSHLNLASDWRFELSIDAPYRYWGWNTAAKHYDSLEFSNNLISFISKNYKLKFKCRSNGDRHLGQRSDVRNESFFYFSYCHGLQLICYHSDKNTLKEKIKIESIFKDLDLDWVL